jgi:hypothetical protein
MAVPDHPSLRTVRADFPHTALQLPVPPVGAEVAGVSLFQ